MHVLSYHYDFSCCFVSVYNLVFHPKEKTQRVFEKRVLGAYLDTRGVRRQEGEENCIMKSSIICAVY